jgi:hypothetical protein
MLLHLKRLLALKRLLLLLWWHWRWNIPAISLVMLTSLLTVGSGFGFAFRVLNV